ncbi:MAG TPA: type II toxin-antitoxin system HipA family toxin [Bacteroidota bacterium]
MKRVARVNVWGTMVGAVAWDDARDLATFEFDESFLKKGLDLSPLRMPLEEARKSRMIYSFPSLSRETYKGLPGLLADSLPDRFGNTLIEAWLSQQGRDPDSFNSVERLCYTGRRGMGALEYEPAIHPFDETSHELDIKELVDLAKAILAERKNLKVNIRDKSGEGLLEIFRVGTSAGGARAKAIIAYDKKTGDVRSGQIDGLEDYEYWIIKFDGVNDKQLGDPKGYGKIEYAYHLMAQDCGIKMTDAELLREDGRAHFMSKRFDREGVKKLHMQTLCAIAHLDYNDPLANSYEQSFQAMRQLKLPHTDMEEFYRRMAFNVIARNQDDHTKNISFLMDENGAWKLSPAYDVTYAYDPKNRWMKAHQMSLNGKRDGIKRSDLLEVARSMNVKKSGEIIDRILETVSHWVTYAKKADVHADQIQQIKKTLLLKL